uniref:Uncharacterized protein n=1 Tax=Anthurium amnicola TaxID=1678845 RepID=A0A1D1Z0C6_9ARAE
MASSGGMDDGKDLERVTLIDVFSEDDILISPSSSSPGAPKPPGPSEADKSPMKYQARCSMQVDQVPLPADSPKLKPTTFCKYNLRKSLAWDSAFFTSEGVLDPEELADVNTTFRKVQTCVLPGIQEEPRKSSESNFSCDSWVAESTEVDLFENLQASIQKSQTKLDKDVSLSHSSSTLSSGKIDVMAIDSNIDSVSCSAFENGHLRSQDKMKPSVVSKKHGLSGQRSVKLSGGTANHPQAVTNESREKLSLRPPRTVSRLPTPDRQPAASGRVHPKLKTEEVLLVFNNVGNSQPVTGSKKLVSGNSRSVTSGFNPSVRGKASLENSTKKTSSRKAEQPSLKSANVCPVRDSKSRYGARNAKAPLKYSSSISPHSSIDSLASESSSSSTSIVRKPTDSPNTIDSGSSSPGQGAPSDYYVTYDNSGRVPEDEREVKASSGSHLLANSTFNATKCSISGYGGKEVKPSGLRLPSPKIGYFDAEKPLPHTSSRYSRRCTQVSLFPKTSGLNNDAVAVKQRPRPIPSSLLQPSKTSAVYDSVGQVRNNYENCTQKDSSRKVIQKIKLNANNVGAKISNVCQIITPSAEESNSENHSQSLSKNVIITGDKHMIPRGGSEDGERGSNHDEKENASPSGADVNMSM